MITRRILSETILFETSKTECKKTLRIPKNYNKILGFFFFTGDGKNLDSVSLSLLIDNKEIIPSGFHAQLVEFKGLLPISEVVYKLDIENYNQLIEFNFKRITVTSENEAFYLYLICEE